MFANVYKIQLPENFKPFAQIQAEKELETKRLETKRLENRVQSKLHALNNRIMLREKRQAAPSKAGGLHFNKSFFKLLNSMRHDYVMSQKVEVSQPTPLHDDSIEAMIAADAKNEKQTGNIFFENGNYYYSGFKSKHKSEVLRHMHVLGLTHFFISADNASSTKVSIIPSKYRS